MSNAYFRFFAELNDFLSVRNAGVIFSVNLAGHETVKHIIESFGVPHTEIDLILVNGQSVDFDYIVYKEDHVSVYPVFESLEIQQISKVRQKPLREPRFINDSHLGKLAGYLRLLGFDTLYRNDFQDEEISKISVDEERIVLTRDRGVLKRKIINRGYLVRSADPQEQIVEVLRRFDISAMAKPYSLCANCNGTLMKVDKRAIIENLEPLTNQHFSNFKQCSNCEQIYWKGSHFKKLEGFVQYVLTQSDKQSNR